MSDSGRKRWLTPQLAFLSRPRNPNMPSRAPLSRGGVATRLGWLRMDALLCSSLCTFPLRLRTRDNPFPRADLGTHITWRTGCVTYHLRREKSWRATQTRHHAQKLWYQTRHPVNTTKHRAAQVTQILSHIKRIIKNKLPNGLAPVHTQREGRRKEEGRGGGGRGRRSSY